MRYAMTTMCLRGSSFLQSVQLMSQDQIYGKFANSSDTETGLPKSIPTST